MADMFHNIYQIYNATETASKIRLANRKSRLLAVFVTRIGIEKEFCLVGIRDLMLLVGSTKKCVKLTVFKQVSKFQMYVLASFTTDVFLQFMINVCFMKFLVLLDHTKLDLLN